MRTSRSGSIGKMISTLCFAFVGLRLMAAATVTEGDPGLVLILSVCALLSLAGALRFQIAWLATLFNSN